MAFMEQLDSVARSTLQAANISAAVLPTLSRDDICDLFLGPEHFFTTKNYMGDVSKRQGVKQSIAMMKALPEMFPSPVAPPKKMGQTSEAMLHILEPTENPDSFLKGKALSCPVLTVSENCMLAVGTTPVTTFPKEDLHEDRSYFRWPMAYGRDATSSYKKAISEWKKF